MPKYDAEKTYKQFGLFVKQARERKGLYQKEVAQMIGVSQPYYCQIESGTRQITMWAALNLCDILDLDFNDFIGSFNKKKASVNRPEIGNSPPV